MNETRELLERVGERFTFPEHAFERFQRRRDRKHRNRRIRAGAVGIAVFVASVLIVTSGGPFDRTFTPPVTEPTIAPVPTGPACADVGPTERPTNCDSRIVEGVPFSLRIPTSSGEGWTPGPIEQLPDGSGFRNGRLLISKSIMGPQGAEAVIFWTSFPDGDHASSPCAGLLSPAVGPSAADLAAAVATAPGTELITGPTEVTLGGYPAKHVMLTVREDVGCDPGFFYSWHSECWGPCWMVTNVGDTISVWIVDVDGTRLFIEAATTTQAGFVLENEVQQIVRSIRFE